MTKLRKKLLLSVLTLALTFIALGSTTFAWFTLGNNATANAFTGTVQGGQGIDIALVNGENVDWTSYEWKMSVDLATGIGASLKFKDVTTADGVLFVDLNNETVKPNVDYVDVSYYIRTLGDISGVKVTKINATSDDFNWDPDATIEGTTNDFAIEEPESWNALNAVRVSFTAYGKEEAGTVVNGTTKVIEFSLSNNDHGSASKESTSVAVLYANKKNFTIPNTTTPLTSGITTLSTKDDNTTDISLLDNILAKPFGTQTVGNNTYKIYKVTFRVWMEGWDGDCINAILNKQVTLGFTLKADYTPKGN